MDKPYVFATRKVPGGALERLGTRAHLLLWEENRPVPREVLLQNVRDAVGLLTMLTDRVDEELLSAAPRLKVVSNMAVGVDNVDLAACSRRGIAVGHTPGVLTETTADLAFGLMLAAARRLVEADAYVRSGNWKTWDPGLLLGADVHGAVLGIAGMGAIGQAVAKRAAGFGMRISYYSRGAHPEVEARTGAVRVSKEQLLSSSDFVSVHVALTAQTRHFIDAAALSLMKPTAILINTTRGPVVDQKALVEALRAGRIAMAGLDVFDPEPPAPDEPLLQLTNVVLAPHLGSASAATRAKMAELAVDNLLAGLEGRPLLYRANR